MMKFCSCQNLYTNSIAENCRFLSNPKTTLVEWWLLSNFSAVEVADGKIKLDVADILALPVGKIMADQNDSSASMLETDGSSRSWVQCFIDSNIRVLIFTRFELQQICKDCRWLGIWLTTILHNQPMRQWHVDLGFRVYLNPLHPKTIKKCRTREAPKVLAKLKKE